jgi:hypothetical protein
LPVDLLWVENPKTGRRETAVPGEVRASDVQVGRHVAATTTNQSGQLTPKKSPTARIGS